MHAEGRPLIHFHTAPLAAHNPAGHTALPAIHYPAGHTLPCRPRTTLLAMQPRACMHVGAPLPKAPLPPHTFAGLCGAYREGARTGLLAHLLGGGEAWAWACVLPSNTQSFRNST